ncbi:hypothetical protein JKP30_21525 [Vibrio vulnificus]|uniref:hypothetical protein n=1 Tax=Vibrio vulnificus TaxID=672 RepID=UPI001CDD476E|nr:hypothetical protein [Vibrio vulnificus]MCA3908355.1 hypothetical protein [Vibrio vulnificus]
MKLVIKTLIIISIGLISIFAVLLYFQQSNRGCLNMPEPEAVDMVNRIFANKQNQTSSDGFIFEHKFESLTYSHEQSRETDSDSSLGFVELQYKDNASKKVIVAVIYSNCEIQWINGT